MRSRRASDETSDGLLAGLLRDDGSVIVPASVAGEVLRALVRDVTERVRANGGEASPACRALLAALYEAAQRREHGPLGDVESSPARTIPAGYVTVAEAAGRHECSARWIQRLARRGALTAVRAGPVWLIDAASLDSYRKGTT